VKTRYLVHPACHEIRKFFPNEPPERGDYVLVKGVEGLRRCRVIRNPKLDWDGLTWKLRGPITVVPEPLS
jgi:hypothetical protein